MRYIHAGIDMSAKKLQVATEDAEFDAPHPAWFREEDRCDHAQGA